MSGIAGVCNLEGGPVSRKMLGALHERLAHRGPDGGTLWLEGPVGLAFQKFAITPESQSETQPAKHACGALLLWDGRLDNREDLYHTMEARTLQSSEVPDSDLVLSAYAHYGEVFLRQLNGDFALALYDPGERKLLLARDVMGGRTLHYSRAGAAFLFASEAKALLGHPGVDAAPNDRRVAEWLYRIPDYSETDSSFFQNIFTVRPGHSLRVTSRGIFHSNFWDFDPALELRCNRYEDYVDVYRETFRNAVRRRLRTAYPVAIYVSGGLDSSSIYAAAHQLTAESAPPHVGVAISCDHPSADERGYQKAIQDAFNVPLVKVECDAFGATFDGIDRPTWHSEGPFLQSDMWTRATRTGIPTGTRVALSGYFGDHLLLNPQFLLDLLFTGRWMSAARHLRQVLNWFEGYPQRAALLDTWQSLKGFLVPERVRPFYHRLRGRLRTLDTDCIGNLYPWLSDRLVLHARALDRDDGVLSVPSTKAAKKVLYMQVWARFHAMRCELETRADAGVPIETAYPFRDRDLIQLLMSIPGEVIYRKGSRGIHRDAMSGILPEIVRVRRTKTSYGYPAKIGALHDFDRYRSRLESGAAMSMGYLVGKPVLSKELTALRSELASPYNGQSTGTTEAFDLLGLEGWLTSYFSTK